MRIQNYSIREIMKRIDGRKMILPALQREFVWKRKDIVRLFDSLLQGFPINTLMFWEVDDILNGVMEYYEFLSPKYQESVSANSIYQVRDNDSKTIPFLRIPQLYKDARLMIPGFHSRRRTC